MPSPVTAGRVGVPDRLVVFPGGRIYFVELKTKEGKLSPMQEREIDRLRRMGHSVAVIDTIENARGWARIMGLIGD